MIIYTICLAFGLIFTIISAVAGHLFGGADSLDGADAGHDAGGHGSDLAGISFFSPTVLAAFITSFGACGLILSRIEATRSVWISAPLSAVAGLAIASGVLLFFNKMFHMTQSSSEARVSSLVGQTASIITPIPADGVGEIAYVRGGSRYTAPARSETGDPVAAGKAVRITRIVGSQFYVDANTIVAS